MCATQQLQFKCHLAQPRHGLSRASVFCETCWRNFARGDAYSVCSAGMAGTLLVRGRYNLRNGGTERIKLFCALWKWYNLWNIFTFSWDVWLNNLLICIMCFCTLSRINCITHRCTEECWTKWDLSGISESSTDPPTRRLYHRPTWSVMRSVSDGITGGTTGCGWVLSRVMSILEHRLIT